MIEAALIVIVVGFLALYFGMLYVFIKNRQHEQDSSMARLKEVQNDYNKNLEALIDKIQKPDQQYLDAIRAQAQILQPEAAVEKTDEDWLGSEESLIQQGADDLSAVFDAEEV